MHVFMQYVSLLFTSPALRRKCCRCSKAVRNSRISRLLRLLLTVELPNFFFFCSHRKLTAHLLSHHKLIPRSEFTLSSGVNSTAKRKNTWNLKKLRCKQFVKRPGGGEWRWPSLTDEISKLTHITYN